MKKYLPLILLAAGILLFIGVLLFVKNQKKVSTEPQDEESSLIDVPLEKRPVVSLIPSPDRHYLNLKIEKLDKLDLPKLDLEFLYEVPGQEQPQGSYPSLDISGKDMFETDLLLGTESSGKFRYDEGVETGSLTLKFRNAEGKLVAKFKTDFHLQKGDAGELTSKDGKFKYSEDLDPKAYYVTMQTIGIPDSSMKKVAEKDGYAVFSSDNFVKSEDSSDSTSVTED